MAGDWKANTPRDTAPVSSFRAKREIFFIGDPAVDDRKTKREVAIKRPSSIAPFRHPERRETSYVRVRMPEQLRPEPLISAKPPPISLPQWGRLAIRGEPALKRPSGIAPFRHPERSEMSDVRKCKGGTVRTESKDLALPQPRSTFRTHRTRSPPFSLRPCPVSSPHLVHIQEAREMIQ